MELEDFITENKFITGFEWFEINTDPECYKVTVSTLATGKDIAEIYDFFKTLNLAIYLRLEFTDKIKPHFQRMY